MLRTSHGRDRGPYPHGMAWVRSRITADLSDDPAWRGIDMEAVGAPASTIFFPVGGASVTGATPSAKVVGTMEINVRAGWCSANGEPLAGAGTTLDLEPMTIDDLPWNAAGQKMTVVSIGEARTAAAWVPLYMSVGPANLVALRVSNIDETGVTGAAAVGVWYWSEG